MVIFPSVTSTFTRPGICSGDDLIVVLDDFGCHGYCPCETPRSCGWGSEIRLSPVENGGQHPIILDGLKNHPFGGAGFRNHPP